MKTRIISHPVRLCPLWFRIACVSPLLVGSARASITVVATADGGYAFTNWTEGGLVVSATASHTFKAADRVLVANFSVIGTCRIISVSAAPLAGGSVTGGGTVADGSNVTVTATANTGYTFTDWTQSGAAVSASYTFVATANRTIVSNVGVIPTTGIHETENENEMEFEWPETAAGWVLQESTDLSHWVNSTRQITISGGKKHTRVSTLNVPGVFFRLVKP